MVHSRRVQSNLAFKTGWQSVKKTRLTFLKFIRFFLWKIQHVKHDISTTMLRQIIQFTKCKKYFTFLYKKVDPSKMLSAKKLLCISDRHCLLIISECMFCEATNNQQLHIRNKVINQETFFGLQDVLKASSAQQYLVLRGVQLFLFLEKVLKTS